ARAFRNLPSSACRGFSKEYPSMRIAILGAGAIARASAAYLLTRGHTPVIWSPSGKGADGYRDTPLVVEGEIIGQFRPEIAESAADAIAGADLILVALPANGHRLVYDHIARS